MDDGLKTILINETARLFASRFCALTDDKTGESMFSDDRNEVVVLDGAEICHHEKTCELTLTITVTKK